MRRLYRMCEKSVWWHRAIDHGEMCFLSSHDSTDWKTPIKNSDQLPIKKYCKCWLIYHPTSFNKSLVGVILMVIPVFLWARIGTCFCAHHAACGKSHKMTAAVLNNQKSHYSNYTNNDVAGRTKAFLYNLNSFYGDWMVLLIFMIMFI